MLGTIRLYSLKEQIGGIMTFIFRLQAAQEI